MDNLTTSIAEARELITLANEQEVTVMGGVS